MYASSEIYYTYLLLCHVVRQYLSGNTLSGSYCAHSNVQQLRSGPTHIYSSPIFITVCFFHRQRLLPEKTTLSK